MAPIICQKVYFRGHNKSWPWKKRWLLFPRVDHFWHTPKIVTEICTLRWFLDRFIIVWWLLRPKSLTLKRVSIIKMSDMLRVVYYYRIIVIARASPLMLADAIFLRKESSILTPFFDAVLIFRSSSNPWNSVAPRRTTFPKKTLSLITPGDINRN